MTKLAILHVGDPDQRWLATSVCNGFRYLGLSLPGSPLVRTRMALDYLQQYPPQSGQWQDGFQAVSDSVYEVDLRQFHSHWMKQFQATKKRCDSLGILHHLTDEQAAVWHYVAGAFLSISSDIYYAGYSATEYLVAVLTAEEVEAWVCDPFGQRDQFIRDFAAPVRDEGSLVVQEGRWSNKSYRDLRQDLVLEEGTTKDDSSLQRTPPSNPDGEQETLVKEGTPQAEPDEELPTASYPGAARNASLLALLLGAGTAQPQQVPSPEGPDDRPPDAVAEIEEPDNQLSMDESKTREDIPILVDQAPDTTTTTEAMLPDRCPVCRKKLKLSDPYTQYNGLTMHQKCFSCRACDNNLEQHASDSNDTTISIEQFTLNGRIKFQCSTCTAVYDKAQTFAKEAGKRVLITEEEYGDTKKVRREIGDDLEQAVYFMTPRCFVCGGDFGTDPKKAQFKCEGRTLFHPVCHATGRPSAETPKPGVKLPASFCAQYLPQQIILKLSPLQGNGKAITTLYFVWKNRDDHAIEIRQQDNDVVTVPFVLDEEAPANPNSSKLNKSGKGQPPTTVALPMEELQLGLVTGIEVAPRHPRMPEAVETSNGQLYAQVEYLKFGLEYLLALTIPIIIKTTEPVSLEERQPPLLDLLEASLTVTIQDKDRPAMG